MDKEDLVLASDFCTHHNIEVSFIEVLNEHGLIQTIVVDETTFLPISELAKLEKLIRLHFELDINIEGIETITHLLGRMEDMQKQIIHLTNILKVYERPGEEEQ